MHMSSSADDRRNRLVDIDQLPARGLQRALLKGFRWPLEKLLAIEALNGVFEDFSARLTGCRSPREVFEAALDALDVRYALAVEGAMSIPAKGPLVAVANHPFGGLEGIILAHLLLSARPDVKVMGNYILKRIPGIADSIIAVDPFGSKTAWAANREALRSALQWLNDGGAMVIFPAGEVSSLQWRRQRIADPPWSRHAGGMIRRSAATVLPVYFPGRNGVNFQLAGLLHPRLRTAMLPRELVKKCGQEIPVCVGRAIPWAKLRRLPDDRSRTDFLRASTYFLQNRITTDRGRRHLSAGSRPHAVRQPVAPPLPASRAAAEVNALGYYNRLAAKGDFEVYLARADQIPCLMHEIGRQREISFRLVQEGTGAAIDLDPFDEHYLHLFLWNRSREELAGAYRLGLTDAILDSMGPSGLYSHQLFRYKPSFLRHLNHAIELGRSFIRPEYQKQFNCLSLLWRGIGEFIVRCPSYHLLFGPVSISQAYEEVSRNLLVQFLTARKFDHALAGKVRPRCPYRAVSIAGLRKSDLRSVLQDIDDVSLLISTIEEDAKGVPVLLRQYLKLNGRLLSFNVDNAFSRVVDGLFMVDLRCTDAKLMARFMGKEGARRFSGFHRLTQQRIDVNPAAGQSRYRQNGLAA
jgi:putative hemolysin